MKTRYRFKAHQLSQPTYKPLKVKTKGDPIGDEQFIATLVEMFEAGGIWHFEHDWHGMLIDDESLQTFLTSTGLKLYLREELGLDQGFLWREGA